MLLYFLNFKVYVKTLKIHSYCKFRSRQLKLKYCRTADKFTEHDTMSAIMVIFKCLCVVLHSRFAQLIPVGVALQS